MIVLAWISGVAAAVLLIAAYEKFNDLDRFNSWLSNLGVALPRRAAELVCLYEAMSATLLIVAPRVGAVALLPFVLLSFVILLRTGPESEACACFGATVEFRRPTRIVVLGGLGVSALALLAVGHRETLVATEALLVSLALGFGMINLYESRRIGRLVH